MRQYQALHTPERGDSVLLREDVFINIDKKPTFSGKRSITAVVAGTGMAGFLSLRVVSSSGCNNIPIGVTIQRPIANVQAGLNVSEEVYDQLEKGGHLEGYEKGKKVVLDNADKGGMSVGAHHGPEGGIKGVIGGDKKIEFENKEIVLSSQVSADPSIYQFEGQQLSARQIASTLNERNGGRAFADGGEIGTDKNPVGFKGNEIILTAPVSSDQRTYDFQGKKMTAIQIASELNQRNGGVSLTKTT